MRAFLLTVSHAIVMRESFFGKMTLGTLYGTKSTWTHNWHTPDPWASPCTKPINPLWKPITPTGQGEFCRPYAATAPHLFRCGDVTVTSHRVHKVTHSVRAVMLHNNPLTTASLPFEGRNDSRTSWVALWLVWEQAITLALCRLWERAITLDG